MKIMPLAEIVTVQILSTKMTCTKFGLYLNTKKMSLNCKRQL